MGDPGDDLTELVDTAAQAYWDMTPQKALTKQEWKDVPAIIKMDVREAMLPIVAAVTEHLAAKKMFQNLEVIGDAVAVPDEGCGDYPAPCNCDDPFTHDGNGLMA